MAECRGCNNTQATRLKTVYHTFPKEDGSSITETCDRCSPAKLGGYVPDVWYGYGSGEQTEENICYPKGHEKEGQRIPFSSKKGKAEAMKIAGIREAGDRKHGMRNESHLNRKIYG